jgi:hypothetical protein
MDFLPDEKTRCHHTGFEKSCREIVTGCGCRKWVSVDGHNPNTGEAVKRFDCADAWVPMLLIENSQMQRQTGAAVESLRNDAVRGHRQQMMALLTMVARPDAGAALPHSNGVLAIEGASSDSD